MQVTLNSFYKVKKKGLVGNIVGKKETATLRKLDNASDKVFLTVNARVEVHPDKTSWDRKRRS